MEKFKNFAKAAILTAGISLSGGEKISAQKAVGDEKIPVPEMKNDYKPENVFHEYGIQEHTEWLLDQNLKESPYLKQLEQLKQIRPNIDPLNYLDKDTFTHDYIQKMDSFSQTVDGHRVIDFKNSFYQGKKQFFLNEIEKYTKDPTSFKGAIHADDDLFLNSIFNRGGFGPDELKDYLEYLHNGVDVIDTRRVYELPDNTELQQQAEKLWEMKNKSI